MFALILGYHVLIASISLDFYGGKVRKGEKIGTAKNRRCVDGVDGEPYLRLQLFRQGRAIDPTFHLQDCNLSMNISPNVS